MGSMHAALALSVGYLRKLAHFGAALPGGVLRWRHRRDRSKPANKGSTGVMCMASCRPMSSRQETMSGYGLWVVQHVADQVRSLSGPGGSSVMITFGPSGDA
jgi:hypothetical protein